MVQNVLVFVRWFMRGWLAFVMALGMGTSLLAAEAATQWTGRFNPREVGRAEFEGLYAAVAG